jgi:hypothetical protein
MLFNHMLKRLKFTCMNISNMPHRTKLHWWAPTVMGLSFFCGIALSLSHHLFNAGLSGTAVPTGSYHPLPHLEFTKQQVNIFVGTAFAFFVRIFLSMATTAAYAQYFWRSMTRTKPQPTLGQLDWAFAGLEDVFGMLDLKKGFNHPVLVGLMVIFWYTF